MRATWHNQYGTTDVIQVIDAEIPTPKADELLVRVHAATVSRTDCALLSATPFPMRIITGLRVPKTEILGTDFAGVVEAIGSAVSGFQVGDKVWGFNDIGLRSHAEYLVVSANAAIAKMPTGLSFAEAAASIEGAFYAYNFIKKVSVGPDSRVLINGATGAIGSALLQLSKHAGATVTAVGGTKAWELLKGLGADRIVDYQKQDFTKDRERYDYIFDAVGKSTFGKCKHLLKAKGVYISSELGPGAQNIILPLVTPLFGKRKVVSPFPTDIPGFLRMISKLIEAGEFTPVLDRSYTLDTIREAYDYAGSGKKTGSVVLELMDPQGPSA